MASNVSSNWLSSWPLLMCTAPNRAMDFRVGASSWIGSTSSGGTHILIREPCCWKWDSSRLHNSMLTSRASLRRFFKSLLSLWISVRDQRARFAESKTQGAKEALALSCPQAHPIGLLQVVRQKLSVPQILRVAQIPWLFSKIPIDRFPLLRCQPSRSPRPLTIRQPGKPPLLKTTNPALNRRGMVPQQITNLITAQPSGNQQYPVQPVIISRLFRTTPIPRLILNFSGIK